METLESAVTDRQAGTLRKQPGLYYTPREAPRRDTDLDYGFAFLDRAGAANN
jgi:hypothetical protein